MTHVLEQKWNLVSDSALAEQKAEFLNLFCWDRSTTFWTCLRTDTV